MGLLECASRASVWRGYDYYKSKKVMTIEETDNDTFSATVSGSGAEPYTVELHIQHPRKSECSCPHAAGGKRTICKHMVAVYFAVLPQEADRFYDEVIVPQEEEERYEEELYDKVLQHVEKMKKTELQQALLELLFDGPEWQLERFVEQNGFIDWDEDDCWDETEYEDWDETEYLD